MSVDKQNRFISDSLGDGVADDIAAMADVVRAKFDEGSVVAILGYGSCFRGVSTADSLIDFYVLVREPAQVSQSGLSARACAVLPPNVYYAETPYKDHTLRTKFAVVDIVTFGKWVGADTKNPYFWARFAQPCTLVWVAGEAEREVVVDHIGQAIKTMYGHCRAMGEGVEVWPLGLAETYRTELRTEGPSRAVEIVSRNADYYKAIVALFDDVQPIKAHWGWRRMQGKLFSVLRLLKASFTFTGGADYLAWKISRHSGVEIKLTPWQRRHPFLTALYLLPGLLRKGAVR